MGGDDDGDGDDGGRRLSAMAVGLLFQLGRQLLQGG